MPHSYTNLMTHVVFSTHERRRIITDELQPRLHAYLGGVIREIGGSAIAIGGVADHVHLLMITPASLSIADALRLVKTNSSKWVGETFHASFSWQRGYGAFSVSRSQAASVVSYIERQAAHHRRRDFRAEFLDLLRRHGIEFDERYLWD